MNQENNKVRETIKERIQKLINYSDKLGDRSKNLNKLLYQQLSEVDELERLEKLEGKYLEAYLLWKSIKRANYQIKLLKLAPEDKEKLLNLIEKEVELIETKNQKEISNELIDEELLEQLSIRLVSKDIIYNGIGGALVLEDDRQKVTIFLDLKTGMIEKRKE